MSAQDAQNQDQKPDTGQEVNNQEAPNQSEDQQEELEEPVMPSYSMRTYYMGFLKRGPNWGKGPAEESRRISNGHMNHIKQMAEDGKLIIAGPFIHPPDAPTDGILAGIFLFDVETLEEAQALCDADPAVQANQFIIELMQWYGPVGITYEGRE